MAALGSWMEAATCGGADWSAPLRESARLLGARAALIIWRNASGVSTMRASWEADPAFMRFCDGVASSDEGAERDQAGLGKVAWAHIRGEDGTLGFFVLADASPDRQLMRDVATMAAAAVVAKARLKAVSAASALKTVAFDQLPLGIVVVDRHISAVERNEACTALLARGDGLSICQDKLLCRDTGDQAVLAGAVARALSNDPTDAVLKAHRAYGDKPYVVRVVAPRRDAGPREHCLLMIVDPDEAPSPGSEIWRAMFDLTECELIIAEGLVSGRRINDIAIERGVSIETVRSQTKRMFERLNVSSQAEAAARLSRVAHFRTASSSAS